MVNANNYKIKSFVFLVLYETMVPGAILSTVLSTEYW